MTVSSALSEALTKLHQLRLDEPVSALVDAYHHATDDDVAFYLGGELAAVRPDDAVGRLEEVHDSIAADVGAAAMNVPAEISGNPTLKCVDLGEGRDAGFAARFRVVGAGPATLLAARRCGQLAFQGPPPPGPCARFELFSAAAQSLAALLQATFEFSAVAAGALHEIFASLGAARDAGNFVLDKTGGPHWPMAPEVRAAVTAKVRSIAAHVELARALSFHLARHHTAPGLSGVDVPGHRREPQLLVDVLDDVTGAWEAIAHKAGLQFDSTVPDGFVVYGEPLLLRQLFHNLCSNAVKYSRPGVGRPEARTVRLSAQVHEPGFVGPLLQVDISNYGLGIEPDEASRIGEYGFRGRFAAREHPLGLGAGVHVAAEIARVHGGYLRVESEALPEAPGVSGTPLCAAPTYRTTASVVLPGELKP